jgi:hypothetical protein
MRDAHQRCDFNVIKIREAAPSSKPGLPRRRKKSADATGRNAIGRT